jgi:hypothetical protein
VGRSTIVSSTIHLRSHEVADSNRISPKNILHFFEHQLLTIKMGSECQNQIAKKPEKLFWQNYSEKKTLAD